MTATVPWLAIGAIVAGVLSLFFIRYLWPYRDRPSAQFFIGTIACEALWALAYGCALFVFSPEIRVLFEIPIWIGINFIGVFFLAFALAYTGRGHLVRSKLMGSVIALQLLHTLIVVTNPLHGIAWTDYQLEPVLGAATVTYTHQPWLFLNFVGIYVLVAAGSFLLLETFFSYGRLYRAQTAAIAASPLLPGIAFTLWLFEIGVSPPVNLTPLTFPLHLAFDMYAFFRRNMFELTPAARRAGDLAAIDDLGSPVVILDEESQIINHNEAALELLATGTGDIRGMAVTAIVDGLDPTLSDQTVQVPTAEGRREFVTNSSALEDSAGNTIGYTLVLQDITAEVRREQRLTVLNRVLRHNLRNDLNVVQMRIGMAAEQASADDLQQLLGDAEQKLRDVIDLGNQARQIEDLLDTERDTYTTVDVRGLIEGIRSGLLAERPDARIDLDIPRDLQLVTDPDLLAAVFENLLENAIEHNDAPTPTAEVIWEAPVDEADATSFHIRDNGSGIPDHEHEVLTAEHETALEHGSGLGLWIVKWAVDSLGGTVEFSTIDSGTTVQVWLPLSEAPLAEQDD